MDRQIVYPGAIPLDTDILNVQRNAMIADGFLAQAMVGTSTMAAGLTCVPTSPASMVVNINPGCLISQQTVDSTAFGSLPSDSDNLMKVGIITEAWASGTMVAPSVSGTSNVYLISAAFSEIDSTPVVLPYYNAANPALAFSGPANSGAAQNTQRLQRVALSLTGPTTAPAVPTTPSGNVPLWTVTIPYGTASISSGMIAGAPGAPLIGGGSLAPGRLLNIQQWIGHGSFTYTPTPGCNTRIWEVRGGGASGGGAAATSATQVAAASGGGSGAFVRHKESLGITSATITVGQGGAAPSAGANAGNAGGASSVVATGIALSAPGGNAGQAGVMLTTGFIVGAGAPASAGTGGSLSNIPGDQGGFGLGVIAGGNYYLASGDGGEAGSGGGGGSVGGTNPGNPGITPGSGGSGAASGGSGAGGSAEPGGAGADGAVWVWEYS